MNQFQNDMNRELESHITRLNYEYKSHKQGVMSKTDQSESANQRSNQLKDMTIKVRQQKSQAISEVAKQND